MDSKDQKMIQISPQMSTSPQDILFMIQKASDNYFIDKAYQLISIYQDCNKEKPKDFKMNDPQMIQLFDQITGFHKEMIFLLEQLDDNRDWICESSNEKAVMSYKLIPNTKTVSLKWEEVMDVPIINACAMIYQIELFNQWVPFCKVSKNVISIKKINKAHKVAYMAMELPFINNRDSFVHGYGIDRLDIDDSFLLCCKSISDNVEFLKQYDIVVPQSKNVQIDIKFFTLQARIINKNQFMLRCVCNLDPKINFLPQRMLNFFTRKIGKILFEKFTHLARNIKGTKWEEAMNGEENKDYYQWIGDRFDEYFDDPQNSNLKEPKQRL